MWNVINISQPKLLASRFSHSFSAQHNSAKSASFESDLLKWFLQFGGYALVCILYNWIVQLTREYSLYCIHYCTAYFCQDSYPEDSYMCLKISSSEAFVLNQWCLKTSSRSSSCISSTTRLKVSTRFIRAGAYAIPVFSCVISAKVPSLKIPTSEACFSQDLQWGLPRSSSCISSSTRSIVSTRFIRAGADKIAVSLLCNTCGNLCKLCHYFVGLFHLFWY